MAAAPAPDDGPASRRRAPESPRIAAWIDPRPDGPDRYTLAPADATGVDQMTRWVTVPADLLRDLTEMR